jgi:chromosome segregation ATPase
MRKDLEDETETEKGKEIKLQQNQLAEYNSLKERARSMTAALHEQKQQLERSLESEQGAFDRLKSQIQTLTDRKANVEDQIKKYRETVDKVRGRSLLTRFCRVFHSLFVFPSSFCVCVSTG